MSEEIGAFGVGASTLGCAASACLAFERSVGLGGSASSTTGSPAKGGVGGRVGRAPASQRVLEGPLPRGSLDSGTVSVPRKSGTFRFLILPFSTVSVPTSVRFP
jgi:hypothetical protein